MGRKRRKNHTGGVKMRCSSCGGKRALVHDRDRSYLPTAFKCRGCGHIRRLTISGGKHSWS